MVSQGSGQQKDADQAGELYPQRPEDEEGHHGEDQAMDELVGAVLESEGIPQLDPETQRQQDIIAEVNRRRAERDAAAQANETKRKSDEIFAHFDIDRDGYMNFKGML